MTELSPYEGARVVRFTGLGGAKKVTRPHIMDCP